MPVKTGTSFMNTKKAKRTRNRRNELQSKFENRAKKNRIRWNYETAKVLDILSNQRNETPEKIFRILLSKSKNRKINYISRVYSLDKMEAKEILETSIKKGTAYKIEVKELQEHILPKLQMNFLDLIDFTQKINIRPDAIVKLKIFGSLWNVKINNWNEIERLNARKILEQESETEYAVLDEIFNVETRMDEQGNIFEIDVSLIKANE